MNSLYSLYWFKEWMIAFKSKTPCPWVLVRMEFCRLPLQVFVNYKYPSVWCIIVYTQYALAAGSKVAEWRSAPHFSRFLQWLMRKWIALMRWVTKFSGPRRESSRTSSKRMAEQCRILDKRGFNGQGERDTDFLKNGDIDINGIVCVIEQWQ